MVDTLDNLFRSKRLEEPIISFIDKAAHFEEEKRKWFQIHSSAVSL